MLNKPFTATPANTAFQQIPFQRIFEAQPGLQLLLSPAFTILGATEAYLHESKTIRENIVGKHILEVFPDNPAAEDKTATDKLKQSLEQVLATGKPQVIETFRYDIPDTAKPGSFLKRFWSTTNTPVLDENGKVILIIHETANVSEEVKAKQLLKESRERERRALAQAEQQRMRLERLLDQAPAAFALLEGPDLVYRVLNNSYQQLFPGRELQGLPLFEALPELRDQPVYDIIYNVYNTGETFEGKEVLIPVARYEGQRVEDIYWNFIYQALYDAAGHVNGVLIFALDVTAFVVARQQVEKTADALQELNRELEERVERRTKELRIAKTEALNQKQQIENLFMQASSAICILAGPDLTFQLVNHVYQQIFPGRELLGKSLLEALPELEGTTIPGILQHVYQTGEAYIADELPLMLARHEGGQLEQIYWAFTFQARHNGEGEIDGVLVFAHEVTSQVAARKAIETSAQEAKAMAAKLAKANQRLMYTNTDLDNFIYTASHDLKAPISNIEMLIEELLMELPAESLEQKDVNSIINMIRGAIARFKKTIASLTEITKLQKDDQGTLSTVSITAVVQEVLLDLDKVIEKTGTQIHISADACTTSSFSEKNLRSIVYNLLSNALKYRSPEREPVVSVSCRYEGDFILLQVQDNGLGMSSDQQTKLFSMFKRFHDHVEGSGVGLYMVKRIVDNVGGKIEVRSTENVGSTFTVYIPR